MIANPVHGQTYEPCSSTRGRLKIVWSFPACDTRLGRCSWRSNSLVGPATSQPCLLTHCCASCSSNGTLRCQQVLHASGFSAQLVWFSPRNASGPASVMRTLSSSCCLNWMHGLLSDLQACWCLFVQDYNYCSLCNFISTIPARIWVTLSMNIRLYDVFAL